MTMSLPMLASDWNIDKLKLPAILQPKVDGVRGISPDGDLVGRSFKSFANEFTTNYFSKPEYAGFDGEFAAEHQCNPRLCNLTTSALNTIEGQPFILWWLFDYVTPDTIDLAYQDRLYALHRQVDYLENNSPDVELRLRLMPSTVVHTLDEVLLAHANYRAMGFEGSILRDPKGKYKNGRSTVREGGLLRIKDFADCEGIVVGVEEGETNGNEAKVNELGYTERSTHQANMSGNSKVGTVLVRLLEDQIVNNGKLTIPKDTIARVSPGRMTHDERAAYLAHPETFVGTCIKLQHFPHGVKDKLRMATFQSIRMKEDMS